MPRLHSILFTDESSKFQAGGWPVGSVMVPIFWSTALGVPACYLGRSAFRATTCLDARAEPEISAASGRRTTDVMRTVRGVRVLSLLVSGLGVLSTMFDEADLCCGGCLNSVRAWPSPDEQRLVRVRSWPERGDAARVRR
jgi:hypothetical protein